MKTHFTDTVTVPQQMLRDYFTTVCKHLVSEHAEMLSVERTNRRIMMTKGEVHVERKERAESLLVNIFYVYQIPKL